MRILIIGATGVLGRATLSHLAKHDVIGTTRSEGKRDYLTALGAHAEVCNVYEPGAIARVAREHAPEVVVNFLTDLANGPGPANTRMRREGGPIVTQAARAAGARRLVIESIAFPSAGAGAATVAAFEHDALTSGLEALVLRFGRFYGPETWTDVAPEAPAIHVAEAGRRAAALIVDGAPGVHIVAEP